MAINFLKKYLLVVFVVIISSNAIGMVNNEDYLPDTVSLHENITQNMNEESFSVSKKKQELIIENAIVTKDTLRLAKAYYELATIQQLQGMNNEAFTNVNKALELYKITNEESGIAYCLNQLGAIYRYGGSYMKALEHHIRSLEIFRKINDTIGEINGLNNKGIVYRNLGNYVKAKEYYLVAIELGLETNSDALATVYNSLGSFFWYKQDNDSALYFYNKALAFEPVSLQLKEKHCAVLNNIGNVYRTAGKLDSSIYYYRLSLLESNQYELNNLTAITLKNLGKSYMLKGMLDTAKPYLNQSIELAKESNLVKVLMEVYLLQSQIYQQQGKYKKSLEKYIQYSHLKDSIISEERLNKIGELEVDYAIQKLEKNQLALKKNIIERDLRIEENKSYIYIFIFITLLLVVVAFFIYLRFLSNKKMKRKLQVINEELEDRVLYRTKSLKDEIEEHKRTENELLKSKIKAEESDKLKSAFLSNMSHEIRTPMNAIVGFSGLLSEEVELNDELSNYVHLIQNNSEKLLNIIADIIDLSKIEANQINLYLLPCKLSNILIELKNNFEPLASEKLLGLSLTIPDNKDLITIKTDSSRLDQILSNLLSNAIKFTESGTVDFGYNVFNEKEIEFFVKDTGIGIPNDAKEFIFRRFRRVEDTQKKFYSGTGLGLSICKELINLLGGRIWLESELGKGSAFYFTLPLIDKEKD